MWHGIITRDSALGCVSVCVLLPTAVWCLCVWTLGLTLGTYLLREENV